MVIGWERHFTRWLGLHEVVIKDVLREQLSRGLAGYVPVASLSRCWQHSKLTNVCSEYHNGFCWYWGRTTAVLLAYKWIVCLIQVEEKAHDSVRQPVPAIHFKCKLFNVTHSLCVSQFPLVVLTSCFPRLPPSSALVVTEWEKSFVFLPSPSSIFHGSTWAHEGRLRHTVAVVPHGFSVV